MSLKRRHRSVQGIGRKSKQFGGIEAKEKDQNGQLSRMLLGSQVR